jgi:hypothetical protein
MKSLARAIAQKQRRPGGKLTKSEQMALVDFLRDRCCFFVRSMDGASKVMLNSAERALETTLRPRYLGRVGAMYGRPEWAEFPHDLCSTAGIR